MTSSIHAKAINLARKHSMRNENDLMQENLFDDDTPLAAVTEKYCSSLLQKRLPPGFELPEECHRYRSFRTGVQRRESNRQDEEKAATIAFAGMNPNETLDAMRARDHGRPHTAQVKRRMTSQNPQKKDSSWF